MSGVAKPGDALACASPDTGKMTLPLDAVSSIREALSIGLACYGQFVELDNACQIANMCGTPWPEEARPVDPTGSADTVTKFAEALRYLDIYAFAERG